MGDCILRSSAAGGKENSMYFDPIAFGKRVVLLRKAHGLTQEELAEELNISYEHMSKIERGCRTCSMELFAQIAFFFKADMNFLVTGHKLEGANPKNQMVEIIAQLTDLAEEI